MRNLEECKAEVFRRSEERIKKRKKNQKYVLALTSTFVLCITVGLVLVKSGILNIGCENAESIECVYAQVDIEIHGESYMNSHAVTDEIQVAELFEMIQNIWDKENDVLREEMQEDFENIMYQNGNKDDSDDLSSGSPSKNMEYVLRFKTSNGTYQIYLLNRGVLLDFTKKEALVLTTEELLNLKEAFGVDE